MYSRKYEPIKIKHNSIDIYVCSYMLFNYIYICHCYATVKMSFVWKFTLGHCPSVYTRQDTNIKDKFL